MRSILNQLFRNSVSSIRPSLLVDAAVKVKNNELFVGNQKYPLTKNCFCVGFGKAVLEMAVQVEKILHEHLVTGIISIPTGSKKLLKTCKKEGFQDESKFSIIEGAEDNIPDAKAVQASENILELVSKLGKDDILLVLISGGGSALLPLPIPPITLEEKVKVIKKLTSAGASITELNCVRQNISKVKGGKLAAAAYPANVVSLILSDIVNDPVDFIASGPTAEPKCSNVEAVNILKKFSVYDQCPQSVKTVLSVQPPKNVPKLSHVQNVIIGNNIKALEATASLSKTYYDLYLILSNSIQGLVDSVAEFYVKFSKLICQQFLEEISEEKFTELAEELCKDYKISLYRSNVIKKIALFRKSGRKNTLCLLMGGETTVQVKGNGTGGRNQELALNLGIKLSELEPNDVLKKFKVWFLSAGTDGIDGPTNAAGAITYGDQMEKASEQNLNPRQFLENNDSYSFFSKLNQGTDLIKTGHTGTNVMDIHILVIEYEE